MTFFAFFCFCVCLFGWFFCKYQGLLIWEHLSVGLEGYCLTSSPVKLTRDVCIMKSKLNSCLLGGEMSRVIFNFHLGKDQSVLCQKKGVGHLFFINRPIHSPTLFGQFLISTSCFIQLPSPPSPPPLPQPATWPLGCLVTLSLCRWQE